MRKKIQYSKFIHLFLALFLLAALTAGGPCSMSVRAENTMDELKEAYVYRLENGQLKYWLDLRGDDLLLHCMFQGEDPTYYETIYRLDTASAGAFGKTIFLKKITDDRGIDQSRNYAFLSVTFVNGKAVMSVVRDEATLAGGANNNLLNGSYAMDPGVPPEAARSEGTQGALKAVKELLAAAAASETAGPYTPQELCKMAQEYYQRHNNYYPPIADYEELEDGRYRIHLYEIVDDGGGNTHTATSAWYTVDASGRGSDDIFGNEIDLTK